MNHLHYGEGTFLRVELCQQSSHSLHVSVDTLAYESIRFTGKGSDRHLHIDFEHHMGPVEGSFVVELMLEVNLLPSGVALLISFD